ncbi:hypothetical protein [Ornithinibacillus sp. JPR2-1]|uniref:hypothetical protein n=1 Tax=Ornithinibacillus sp. JPR2-1 TaxID=2094019 RepID=UPI0031D20006
MPKQVGRNVYHEESIKRVVKLSLLSKLRRKYYECRVKIVERKIHKYGSFSFGYQHELFQAAVYLKQSYLHKVEALYERDEVRELKRAYRKENGA